MKITIYRFNRGYGGEFHVDGAVWAEPREIRVYSTRNASSVLVPTTIKVIDFEGHVCQIMRERGRACVFVPPSKKAVTR